ncbi:hypothetical protein [Spirosoma endophyticum]|uniref:Uncharacterized protein n=1 Tax=Spirosoma endophyticum TaxID=662367 RepID=A0A1I2GZQ5_9BACT|nr:hypothetical protein [Spirosoma endophyticum]SFF22001.1 hypothetical protein SAMN05216167_13619 [Spirosoma endophyticum]
MSWLDSLKLKLGFQPQPYRFHIPEKKKEYVVRVNNPDGRSPYLSHIAFHYPKMGYVQMPGYRSNLDLSRFTKKDDGMGLFGLWRAMGQPLSILQYAEKDSVYCLIEVRRDEMVVIDKGREVKFPRGNVLYSGDCPKLWGTYTD